MSDIILLHANATHGIFGALGDDLVAVEQPLWCRLLAGYLEDRGHCVEILDAEAERLSVQDVVDWVEDSNPKLVAIVVAGHQPSASSQQMVASREFAGAIKNNNPRRKIIMTGNHPSALPVRTLMEEPVDWVCDGEGPVTLDALLRDLPLKDIPGLVWKDHGGIHQNQLAGLLDLNKDLHGNAWHLLDMTKYKSHNWQRLDDITKRQPYAAIYTSLGCSYKCNFCMINVFQHTNRYRMRAPQAVVDEMVMLNQQYGVETFKFTDELFVLNRRHTQAICEGIISAGLGDKISSWCYSRTDSFDPEMLPLFRRAGFNWFALGIESGSKKVRQAANKALKSDDIVDKVRLIEAAGINVISNFIFGLPSDDLVSMQETLDLACELNTAFANFYVCQAYPGSALYDEAVAKGWTLPETWAGYSQHNYWTRPLDTEHVDAATVLRFRDEAFVTYFSNPAYQMMIHEKFGWETLAHINKMLTYKLKRKLLEAA